MKELENLEKEDLESIYKEHDIYLLNKLSENLFGIKDLYSKLKEILNQKCY